jgi:hypothetical protein
MRDFSGVIEDIPIEQFNCDYFGSTYFVCRPKTSGTSNEVIRMQKAIDAFLNKVTVFNRETKDAQGNVRIIIENAIGVSKAGYDGRVGSETASWAQSAIWAAKQLYRNAGEMETESLGINSIESALDIKERTKLVSQYCIEVADYLEEASKNVQSLINKMNVRVAEETRILLAAGLKKFTDVFWSGSKTSDIAKSESMSGPMKAGLWIGGAILIFAFTMWAKKPKEKKYLPGV